MNQIYTSETINDMPQRFRANFINSLSGYKSANLIGTCNGSRHTNLAIVTSVFHVGANPPLMGMLMRPHTVTRDTLGNIKEQGYYTINAVPVNLYAQAHQTSARYTPEQSEFDHCGFTPRWQDDFAAPFVAESPMAIGLRLETIQKIEANQTELVIGRIERVLLDEQAVEEDGTIDISQLSLACVSGLDTYHQASGIAKMAYAKPDKAPTALKLFNADQ